MGKLFIYLFKLLFVLYLILGKCQTTGLINLIHIFVLYLHTCIYKYLYVPPISHMGVME